MKINEILEAFNIGKFPEPDSDVSTIKDKLLYNSEKLADISPVLELYRNQGGYYFLIREQAKLVGFVKLSEVTIKNVTYSNIDLVYIVPEFRKTSAIKYLLYSVKEQCPHTVIADGAIFTGGQNLIAGILNHNLLNVKILNKETGKMSPFSKLINDPDLCYIFEQTKLGYGKQLLPEGCGYTWYPLFEDF